MALLAETPVECVFDWVRGVKPHNAAKYAAAGADMLTVGTGIYHAPNVEKAVRQLREETAGTQNELARQRGAAFLNRRWLSAAETVRRDKHFRYLEESLEVRLDERHCR